MKDIYQILKEPVITEKSTTQRTESNKVVFWVDLKANKNDIKESVEKVFNVNGYPYWYLYRNVRR